MLNADIFNLDKETLKKESPVYSMLCEYAEKEPVRFHMPGHKGALTSPLYPIFGDVIKLDVTELPETDNLFEPQGPFLEAEKLCADLYSSRVSVFSAGGSTLCIEAMLRLATFGGGKVLCARNVHKSVINSLALLGVEPVFVLPRPFPGSGLAGEISPIDIEEKLKANKDICAVFITSPDYYGIISDVFGISKVCRKYGVLLLVDNAHGAHLIEFKAKCGTLHPISQGADMCCDSAHKTLPALTGASYLHINTPRFSRENAKEAMMLFGSTSPSYFISLSLDIARVWLKFCGKKAFSELAEKVADFRAFAESLGFFTPKEAVFDPVRIVIDTASRGISGGDAAEFLRENGIIAEMSDKRHVVLIPTPFNGDTDFIRLKEVIAKLPLKKALPEDCDFDIYSGLPERKMGLRKALCLPCETVSIEKAKGRISAQTKCPCPPCIPVVMPGEVITAKTALYLKSYGVLEIKVLK